jgi:hypothetical protein
LTKHENVEAIKVLATITPIAYKGFFWQIIVVKRPYTKWLLNIKFTKSVPNICDTSTIIPFERASGIGYVNSTANE